VDHPTGFSIEVDLDGVAPGVAVEAGAVAFIRRRVVESRGGELDDRRLLREEGDREKKRRAAP
jgi:hypothetical protein